MRAPGRGLVVFSLGHWAGILYELYAYLADSLLGASIVAGDAHGTR